MSGQEKWILLAEDNPDDQELILRTFKKHNLANRIHVVDDGVKALDFVFGKGEYANRDVENPPQVVILDIKMPRMDGLEVLKQLRSDERTARIPVVILTSSDQEDDILRSYEYGANSYVRKPVDFSDFSEVSRQLGLYWLLINQSPVPA